MAMVTAILDVHEGHADTTTASVLCLSEGASRTTTTPSATGSPARKEPKRKNPVKWLVGGANCLCRAFFVDPLVYIRHMRRNFGDGLLVMLTSNYLFVKGMVYSLTLSASAPIFREMLHLGAEKHNAASAIYMIPWSLKGVLGTSSDVFAPFGYHKRPFMMASSIFGVTGAALLASYATNVGFLVAVSAFFMMMMQASFNDLLCEGAYTRQMAEKPDTGAGLTSFVWLCTSLGSLLAALWVGPIIDYVSFRVLVIPFLFLTAQQLFAVAWPWPFKAWKEHGGLLNETLVSPGDRVMSEKFHRFKKLFACALVLSLLAMGSVAAGLFNDEKQIVGMGYALLAGLVMMVMLYSTLPAALFKPILYLFLSRFLTPNIGSQVTYWLRSGPDCVEDSPHFSWTFLLTLTSILQSVFGFIGVTLFQKFVSKWTFRKALWITSLLTCLTSVFDVAMIYRWNVKYLGIPDKVWYFCSAAVIEEVVGMWAFMPSCVMISRLCPRQVESTMYAVVAGVNNFGSSLAKYLGNFLCVFILHIKTINDETGRCNFDNLGLAVIISSGVAPLIPLLLTFFLVPDVSMSVHFGENCFLEAQREIEQDSPQNEGINQAENDTWKVDGGGRERLTQDAEATGGTLRPNSDDSPEIGCLTYCEQANEQLSRQQTRTSNETVQTGDSLSVAESNSVQRLQENSLA